MGYRYLGETWSRKSRCTIPLSSSTISTDTDINKITVTPEGNGKTIKTDAARAVDPDPGDTAFQVNPDPDTDPDPIRIQDFDDQKTKEIKYSWKLFKSFFDQKLQFTYV